MEDKSQIYEQLTVMAPRAEAHREALAQMYARLRASHLDRSTSRIGVLGNDIITRWPVFDLTIRIGRVHAKVAAVDGVETHEDYRQCGLMGKTGQAALQAMRRHGYDLSLLLSILDDFYDQRFGYISAWPQRSVFLRTQSLPQTAGGALHMFTPSHPEDLAALYNHHHAGLTGTAVKPAYRHFKWPGHFQGWYWMDAQGNKAGYLIGGNYRGRHDVFEVKDAAGDPKQILGVAGQLARHGDYEQVEFERLHARSALSRLLRRLDSREINTYRRSQHFMIRIVNLHGLLTKLGSELARRLQSSYLATWVGELVIANAEEQVVLRIDHGDVRVCPMDDASHTHAVQGGSEIAQLVVGSAPPEEIVDVWQTVLQGEAGHLIEVLFPAQQPQIAPVDL